jgi:hypothetical protein
MSPQPELMRPLPLTLTSGVFRWAAIESVNEAEFPRSRARVARVRMYGWDDHHLVSQ